MQEEKFEKYSDVEKERRKEYNKHSRRIISIRARTYTYHPRQDERYRKIMEDLRRLVNLNGH